MKTEARYLQVKNHIIQGIREHLWLEDELVPSENELVKTCAVSRMTARRALKELTSEGVLYSHQGRGTFVATAKSRSSVMTLRNIAEEIQARNHQHRCEIINLEKSDNKRLLNHFESDCIDDLNQPVNLISQHDGLLFFSRIIHFENDLPIQLEERFVNPDLAPDYLSQDFHLFTPNEYLMKVCPVSEADHTVEAVMPTDDQKNWLQLSPAEPCLKITRTTWAENQIASFAWLYHPGNRFQLGNHIKLKEE